MKSLTPKQCEASDLARDNSTTINGHKKVADEQMQYDMKHLDNLSKDKIPPLLLLISFSVILIKYVIHT